MSRKRDIKQFGQACGEVGLTEAERFAASKAYHAEKEATGKADASYRELVDWLRQWKSDGH